MKLESQNDVALKCIAQIRDAMDELNPCNADETFGSITDAIERFKKYSCTELCGKPNEELLYDSFIKWHNSDEYLIEYNPGAWEMECRFRIWLHLSKQI